MSLTNKAQVETNKVLLTIEISPADFEAAVEKAYRKNVKKMSVPGFRQGKAPRKMIEKLYGEGVFFEDAINDLYPIALGEAIEEAAIEVVARPDVEVKSVSVEEGVVFEATCIVKPEVEISAYKGLEVKFEKTEVTEEEIDARLKGMQERNARTIDVTDRPSKDGDIVVFDFDGYVDDVAFDGGKAEKFELTIGSGQFIPGFEPQLENRNIGDEFDVNVTFPEEYHAEELKGKPAVFKCKLHGIKEKELPVLDDEFAKDVSEFDTLDALKADLRTKMQADSDKRAEADWENKLIDAVIGNMTAEVPEVMFENRTDDLVQDFSYRLQSQGMSLDLYLQYTGMELSSFRETFKEQAEKQVKIRLALEKIVALEGITATEEDVEKELTRLSEAYHMELAQVKSMVPVEEVSKDLAVNKAIDLIKETAVRE